ncbi:hypothetical protein [Sphingomicrobium aestuariivivum]|uniref:hypothetical protein n=1 Tax=Sphingomicrobium aestuariivivum TaxID=1582356 RepID=UPI001FD63EA6|nr:hypothetical protein [Sphingomicrobium aestuariivivum]MCJ8191726.1 hypothetical protein [Sphingomicrobium aestuariivivum]
MRIALFALFLLTACRADGDIPALDPRPAEAIDPRLPVGSPDPAPGTLTVAGEIAMLAARLEEGRAAFDAQYPIAAAAVSTAGAEGSESWVAAQEEMGLLVRAREQVARVIGDAAELSTGQIAEDDWASPRDRDAVNSLLARAIALDSEQGARITGLEARLD